MLTSIIPDPRISIEEIWSEYQFNSVLAEHDILRYSGSKRELTIIISLSLYLLE